MIDEKEQKEEAFNEIDKNLFSTYFEKISTAFSDITSYDLSDEKKAIFIKSSLIIMLEKMQEHNPMALIEILFKLMTSKNNKGEKNDE